MVNCCCLPDCRSGCRGVDKTISLFRAPKDPVIFQKWSNAVQKFGVDLKVKHFICEKHFLNEDILREKVLRDPEGNIIFQRKYDKTRVRHGAVPFASASSLAATNENTVIPVPMDVVDEGVLENNVAKNLAIAKHLIAIETVQNDEIEEKSVEFEGVKLYKKRTLFDDIYNGIVKLKLPDLSWGIHMREEPTKCITISQIEKCNDTNKIPTYVKQITLNEQLNLKLFALNSKVVEKAATTIQEVQSALEELYNVQLCVGSPVIGRFQNVHSYCTSKDVVANRWRHNLCTLVTQQSVSCSKCRLLDEILQRHLNRKHKLKKLHIVVSSTQKKKIEIMRKAHRVQTQAF